MVTANMKSHLLFRQLPLRALFLVPLILGWIGSASALTFPLPAAPENVVGKLLWTQARQGDTFCTIGRRYDVGYVQLEEANPSLKPEQLEPGTIVVIPSRFILPNAPHKGIVVNLAELRIYYYPPDQKEVITYPIGIGREGWVTPVGEQKIIEKTVNPTWVVPASIQKDRAKDGVFLPKSVPPGPENPLGGYRMRLTQPTYLLHGTNDYTGVGRRSSSGCIRLFPEDVEALFPQVKIGTPVKIINQAYKAGWSNHKLYLEAHTPLQEHDHTLVTMRDVVTAITLPYTGQLSWNQAERVASEQNGIPQVIGSRKSL